MLNMNRQYDENARFYYRQPGYTRRVVVSKIGYCHHIGNNPVYGVTEIRPVPGRRHHAFWDELEEMNGKHQQK